LHFAFSFMVNGLPLSSMAGLSLIWLLVLHLQRWALCFSEIHLHPLVFAFGVIIWQYYRLVFFTNSANVEHSSL
jgi:hypothetical protein